MKLICNNVINSAINLHHLWNVNKPLNLLSIFCVCKQMKYQKLRSTKTISIKRQRRSRISFKFYAKTA